jgi:hypothetical protein
MQNSTKKREENTMKYETPEMTVLTPAINAIQSTTNYPQYKNCCTGLLDTPYDQHELTGAYADWE